MNPTLSRIILIVSVGVSICLVAYRPEWIGDSNLFLRNFINHEYLNILGVILAITLASLSQLHLSLRRLSSVVNGAKLAEVRSEIRSSAVWLIAGFIVGLIAVLVKPLVVCGEAGAASLNAFCLVVLLFYILVLTDITLSVFDLDIDEPDQ